MHESMFAPQTMAGGMPDKGGALGDLNNWQSEMQTTLDQLEAALSPVLGASLSEIGPSVPHDVPAPPRSRILQAGDLERMNVMRLRGLIERLEL